MTLSLDSEAVAELYSVLARQGSPQEAGRRLAGRAFAARGELRVVELVGEVLGPGGHRPPVSLDAGAQVQEVDRIARSHIVRIPPGAAEHLIVEPQHSVYSAAERLVDLEARVDGVLRQQWRLVAGHWRILHVANLPIRVAGVGVQVQPVRRSGTQLELATLVPRVEIAEVLSRGRGIEVEEVAVVRIGVVERKVRAQPPVEELAFQ